MPSDEFLYQMDLAIGELVDRLPADDGGAIENTRWIAADSPTSVDLIGFEDDAIMLGLYEAPRWYTRDELLDPSVPPPTITLFELNIRMAGFTAKEVVTHEAGHRLGYHHDSAPVIPCGTEYTKMPDVVRAVESLPAHAAIACRC